MKAATKSGAAPLTPQQIAAQETQQKYGKPERGWREQVYTVIFEAETRTGRAFDWDFQQDGEVVRVPMAGPIAVNDADASVDCALQGLGLAQAAMYQVREYLDSGALVAVLGGLDMLVFTAGIGEHNAAIRERVCAGLAWLGVAVDAQANAQDTNLISSATSRIPVAVERTNEEWVAAWHATRVLGLQ